MTYTVSSGTLNTTIPYHTVPYHTIPSGYSYTLQVTEAALDFLDNYYQQYTMKSQNNPTNNNDEGEIHNIVIIV